MDKTGQDKRASDDCLVIPRIAEGDLVIFQRVDGKWFDANVLRVDINGATVCYLEGYKSRGPEVVPFSKIVARVDLNRPKVRLRDAPYSGNFEVF